MADLWIIESRDPVTGALLLRESQPETVFGDGAMTGMTHWQMSRVIYGRLDGDLELSGADIEHWPRLLNPTWIARRKTW